MALTMRPERKKRNPRGTTTAAAGIAIEDLTNLPCTHKSEDLYGARERDRVIEIQWNIMRRRLQDEQQSERETERQRSVMDQ